MERSRMYKNQDKDSAELRRRRQDESVELRKAKKNDTLQKRRNIVAIDSGTDDEGSLMEPSEKPAPLTIPTKTSSTQEEALECIKLLLHLAHNSATGCDINEVKACVQRSRSLLSKANDPPIDLFVNGGAVPVLLALLHEQAPIDLQFEATWALTNIASGTSDHTKAVVDAGGVEPFIRLLSSPDANVAEQAAWALGNIAGDSCEYRDLVINKGIVDPLIKLLDRSKDHPAMIGHIAWVMSNLCRCKSRMPPTPTWVLERLIPYLAKIATKKGYLGSSEAQVDAYWALTYASECSQQEILEIILKTGVMKTMMELLSPTSPDNTLTPALRCVGNMLTGSDDLTERLLTFGLLKRLGPLLSHKKAAIVKETCWLLSNITAGTQDQIEQVVQSNILPLVVEAMKNGDNKTQREALWTITNLVNLGRPKHLQYALDLKILSSCCHMLRDSQPKILLLCMELLQCILAFAQTNGQLEDYAVEFEAAGGMELLETLQEHENEEVYQHALALVERFFNAEEEHSVLAQSGQAEVAFQSPTGDNGSAFSF